MSSVSGHTVSVVLIVRNGEAHLVSALESIAAQTYPPAEILVIDGHSTDRTAEIIRSFPQADHILQQGIGISAAYNEGIERATGEFVAFLAHDDLWTPDKLAVQIAFMAAHPEILYTTTRATFFLEPGQPIPPGFKANLLQGDYDAPMLETLVAHRSVFQQVGPFNPDLISAQDVDWLVRLVDSHLPGAALPQVLLHKGIHSSNSSLRTINTDEMLKALHWSVLRKRGSLTDPS